MILRLKFPRCRFQKATLLFLSVLFFINSSISEDPDNKDVCRPKGDVVLGIDSSFSINNPDHQPRKPNNFNNVKKFVAGLVESLDENNFRTGVFAWSNTTDLVYKITENLTMAQKVAKIKKMPYQAKNTLTDVAIRFGIDMLLDKDLTPRPGVAKMLIIMTDGDPYPPRDRNISGSINDMKVNSIMPIAIGIGTDFKVEGLTKIAFGRQEDVITSESFDALPLVLEKLKNLTCYIPQKPQAGQVILEEVKKNTQLYYCYPAKGLYGIYVNLDVLKGNVKAYYSFNSRTPTADKNEGEITLDKGKVLYDVPNPQPNITDPVSEEGEIKSDAEMCICVVSLDPDTQFKIDFGPGKVVPIPDPPADAGEEGEPEVGTGGDPLPTPAEETITETETKTSSQSSSTSESKTEIMEFKTETELQELQNTEVDACGPSGAPDINASSAEVAACEAQKLKKVQVGTEYKSIAQSKFSSAAQTQTKETIIKSPLPPPPIVATPEPETAAAAEEPTPEQGQGGEPVPEVHEPVEHDEHEEPEPGSAAEEEPEPEAGSAGEPEPEKPACNCPESSRKSAFLVMEEGVQKSVNLDDMLTLMANNLATIQNITGTMTDNILRIKDVLFDNSNKAPNDNVLIAAASEEKNGETNDSKSAAIVVAVTYPPPTTVANSKAASKINTTALDIITAKLDKASQIVAALNNNTAPAAPPQPPKSVREK